MPCDCSSPNKMNIRNYITGATITAFLAIVLFIVFVDSEMTENPVLMFILGSFMTAVTMVYTFYYRKNPSNRKKQKFNDNFDDYGNDMCPCCGQELKALD